MNYQAALFDMDGVLFNSMPRHARAWKMLCDAEGIEADEDEFFLYEGRTGASTINILFRRQFGREASPEEIKRLYGIKTENFKSLPDVDVFPGARECLDICRSAGVPTVLVTGSGQGSLLERLDREFPGAFPPERRVTARDVIHGKPSPEPFLAGAAKCGADPRRCIAIDNAPLGVESAAAAGCFTIGVNTGPIPAGELLKAGADIELASMAECAEFLRTILHPKSV